MSVTLEQIIAEIQDETISYKLGKIFQDIRIFDGLSQREAAIQLDTVQSRICAMEKGDWDPKLSTLLRYAHGYGYEVEISIISREEGREL